MLSCSRIFLSPRSPFTYSNIRLLPPHLSQANTSPSNVLLSVSPGEVWLGKGRWQSTAGSTRLLAGANEMARHAPVRGAGLRQVPGVGGLAHGFARVRRRVASLEPPPRANLTRFHGVFAPGAKLRPFLVPQEGADEAEDAACGLGTNGHHGARRGALRYAPSHECSQFPVLRRPL
ncbi:Transposase, IS801/IS1294 family protein [Stigmatella aurantiaca DW4/3-1]|uniref:Transposase, IS801/IS1294 family protein n=1 Tax=Stigmatella aurantiaca (strain DW4/3-1) TaxID=378806 RepID=E3FUK8_STIAD|nr:Transposase, IS801/IS1294 family protein [Stigmatella aurantiaca DW4/3-1]